MSILLEKKNEKYLNALDFSSDDQIEVIKTNQGREKLIYRNHMYTIHQEFSGKTRWRCVARSSHCRGAVTTIRNFNTHIRLVNVNIGHNHPPNLRALETAKLKFNVFGRGSPPALRSKASSSKSFPSTSTSTATRSQQSPKILPNTKKPTPSPSTSRAPAPTPVHLRIAPKPQPPPSPAPPVLVPLPSPIQVSQDVCLRWNSYHTNMQNSFPMLLDTEQFVDVTLACEGQFIKCHKMVLSACSTFFNELLNQNPCQHPIIVLRGSKMWEIRALIDFMYRGEVNVAQDKLASLLQAAEEFQVKGLAGSSTRAPDNSPLHHIPNSPPDPTYHPGDSIDDHKPSPSKKILKRKAPQSYEPNVIHHQTSRKVPLQPIPKLKIKTREILNSTTDTDYPMKSDVTNQSHSKKMRQTDSDESDGPPPSKKSSGTKDNLTEVQIKEECLDYVDFDVASNSGSYPGTNYQQQDENGDDENYDDNNSMDPLNVDKLQCDGYDTPYD